MSEESGFSTLTKTAIAVGTVVTVAGVGLAVYNRKAISEAVFGSGENSSEDQETGSEESKKEVATESA